MRRVLLLLFAGTLMMHGELLDRIAIAVVHDVITEQQIDEEIRAAALQSSEPVKGGLETRRSAADRLLEQAIIAREIAFSKYPLPTEEQVATALEQVKERWRPTSLPELLDRYRLTEQKLRAHLERQLMILQFIEYRFRAGVQVTEEDLRMAYEKRREAWRLRNNTPPPTLEQTREALRSELIEERINYDLDAWLEESRKRLEIVYFDQSLQ